VTKRRSDPSGIKPSVTGQYLLKNSKSSFSRSTRQDVLCQVLRN